MAATSFPLSTCREALSLYAYNRATVAGVAGFLPVHKSPAILASYITRLISPR